ncbi:hypothetical protein Barb7_00137 [Bacteroidales bacterium Barb7]|nr:hypothetical protein Barb7_00137 [Bacteroidales bacterium Barb7]
MKTIYATIERASDGGYGVYTANGGFTGMGDTIEEAKESLRETMRLQVEVSKEDGVAYPAYLDGGYEIIYNLDIQSFLEFTGT